MEIIPACDATALSAQPISPALIPAPNLRGPSPPGKLSARLTLAKGVVMMEIIPANVGL
jgi:hypothetical protein